MYCTQSQLDINKWCDLRGPCQPPFTFASFLFWPCEQKRDPSERKVRHEGEVGELDHQPVAQLWTRSLTNLQLFPELALW